MHIYRYGGGVLHEAFSMAHIRDITPPACQLTHLFACLFSPKKKGEERIGRLRRVLSVCTSAPLMRLLPARVMRSALRSHSLKAFWKARYYTLPTEVSLQTATLTDLSPAER